MVGAESGAVFDGTLVVEGCGKVLLFPGTLGVLSGGLWDVYTEVPPLAVVVCLCTSTGVSSNIYVEYGDNFVGGVGMAMEGDPVGGREVPTPTAIHHVPYVSPTPGFYTIEAMGPTIVPAAGP